MTTRVTTEDRITELEAEVESAMDSLGDPDDAFRYHHSYVIAVARKVSPA